MSDPTETRVLLLELNPGVQKLRSAAVNLAIVGAILLVVGALTFTVFAGGFNGILLTFIAMWFVVPGGFLALVLGVVAWLLSMNAEAKTWPAVQRLIHDIEKG